MRRQTWPVVWLNTVDREIASEYDCQDEGCQCRVNLIPGSRLPIAIFQCTYSARLQAKFDGGILLAHSDPYE